MTAAKDRPVYIAKFRARPNTDAIRALRLMLKSALRIHGLTCISIEEQCYATPITENSTDP